MENTLLVFIEDVRKVKYLEKEMEGFTEEEKEKIIEEAKKEYLNGSQKMSFFFLVLSLIEKHKKEKKLQELRALPGYVEKPIKENKEILKILKFLKPFYYNNEGILWITSSVTDAYGLNLDILDAFFKYKDIQTLKMKSVYAKSNGRDIFYPCKNLGITLEKDLGSTTIKYTKFRYFTVDGKNKIGVTKGEESILFFLKDFDRILEEMRIE